MKRFLIYILCLLLLCSTALAATDTVDRHFTESTTFLWQPSQEGLVKDISIDGEITGTGKVRIYLIAGGEQYLIFARSPETELLDLEDYVELSEGNSIGLFLEYGDGSWDSNNDGIASSSDGVDYSLNPFVWQDLEDKNFCSLWDVYSIEEETYTTSCYGASSCCDFLNYDSRQPDWNREYVLIEGTDGATENNLVLARVVYYDGNQVLYSNYDALEGSFVESEVSGSVENITRVYNATSHFLRIDLDEGAIFNLKHINYDLASEEKEQQVVTSDLDPISHGSNDSVPKPIAEPATIKQTPTTFTIKIPSLTEKSNFNLDDTLYIKSIEVSSENIEEDVILQGHLDLNDGASQLISFNIPENVSAMLHLEVPLDKLKDDPSAFKIEVWDEDAWNSTPFSYLKVTESTASYELTLKGDQQVFFRALGKTTITDQKIDLGFSFKTFSFFLIAIVLVLILFFFFGIKKIYYREIKIGFEEKKFSKDVKHVHNLREEMEKL